MEWGEEKIPFIPPFPQYRPYTNIFVNKMEPGNKRIDRENTVFLISLRRIKKHRKGGRSRHSRVQKQGGVLLDPFIISPCIHGERAMGGLRSMRAQELHCGGGARARMPIAVQG